MRSPPGPQAVSQTNTDWVSTGSKLPPPVAAQNRLLGR